MIDFPDGSFLKIKIRWPNDGYVKILHISPTPKNIKDKYYLLELSSLKFLKDQVLLSLYS